MNILNPFKINNITLPNRISVASMCQYSADKGNPSKWHYSHLQRLAISGAGMLMLESTAVSLNGRITLRDLVLANRKNEISFKKIIKYLRTINKIPLGIQISHAGRKGSAQIPWIKSNYPLKKNQKRWKTYAPSAIRRDSHWPKPKSLSILQIKKIVNDFKNCSKRANRIGFDCLEIHMAHGYLLHEFYSPISNKFLFHPIIRIWIILYSFNCRPFTDNNTSFASSPSLPANLILRHCGTIRSVADPIKYLFV